MTARQLSTAEHLDALRARVNACWEAMNAARLDYLRAMLDLHVAKNDPEASERTGRQIRNLLNIARPKRRQPRKGQQ